MKNISLAHGSGGKLTHNLIKTLFLEEFKNPFLSPLTDSAILNIKGTKIAFTTDSYTVNPIFFPGGDIGKLAVCGTINDLAVMGATPLSGEPVYISCGYIIEEGFKYEELVKITQSISKSAKEANVLVVTGDTKVVEKGKVDKIFINTSGIGLCRYEFQKIKVGDRVLINGGIGEHEIAVLVGRKELGIQAKIKSDCASLSDLISNILKCSNKIKFMRDPTRGGIATTLNELVEGRNFGVLLYEDKLPIKEEVKGVCSLLGFDPLYLANEGKVIIVVASKDADKILENMRKHPIGKKAEIIGEITDTPSGKVYIKTQTGGTRLLDMLTGEQLPRIC